MLEDVSVLHDLLDLALDSEDVESGLRSLAKQYLDNCDQLEQDVIDIVNDAVKLIAEEDKTLEQRKQILEKLSIAYRLYEKSIEFFVNENRARTAANSFGCGIPFRRKYE